MVQCSIDNPFIKVYSPNSLVWLVFPKWTRFGYVDGVCLSSFSFHLIWWFKVLELDTTQISVFCLMGHGNTNVDLTSAITTFWNSILLHLSEIWCTTTISLSFWSSGKHLILATHVRVSAAPCNGYLPWKVMGPEWGLFWADPWTVMVPEGVPLQVTWAAEDVGLEVWWSPRKEIWCTTWLLA